MNFKGKTDTYFLTTPVYTMSTVYCKHPVYIIHTRANMTWLANYNSLENYARIFERASGGLREARILGSNTNISNTLRRFLCT